MRKLPPWAAASIYELAVYGEGDSGDSGETMEIPIQTASGRDESYAQELDGAWRLADGCSVPPLR